MVLPSMLPHLLFFIMRLKCFDLGTNSLLYLHSQIDRLGRLTPVEFRVFAPRLGKSLDRSGSISRQSQLDTISIIKRYLSPRDNCLIAGTCALRQARNRNDFTSLVRRETGRRIIILNKHEEARLVFAAVKHYMSPLPGKTIVCDIGGGSTEFIIALKGKITKITSIPAGAVRLSERFKHNTDAISSLVKTIIKPRTGFHFIGTGGTVTSMGAIALGLPAYCPGLVHRLSLSLDKVSSISSKLKSLNLGEKKKLLRFDPSRADIITAGSCILQAVMESFAAERIRICDRGLIYGLALSYRRFKGSGLI